MNGVTLLYNQNPLLGLAATAAPLVAYYYNYNVLAAILVVVLLILVFNYRWYPQNEMGRLYVDDNVVVCPATGTIVDFIQTNQQTYIKIYVSAVDPNIQVFPANCRVLLQSENTSLPTQYNADRSVNPHTNQQGYDDTLNAESQFTLMAKGNKYATNYDKVYDVTDDDNFQTSDAVNSGTDLSSEDPAKFNISNYLACQTSKQSANRLITHLLQMGNGVTLRLSQIATNPASILRFDKRRVAYAGEVLGSSKLGAFIDLLIPHATPSKYQTPDYTQFYFDQKIIKGSHIVTGQILGRYY